LWIGTYGGGIDRYDGAAITNYSKKNGLSDNSVFSIIEDRQGNIWIGTVNGLNKYDGRYFTVYTSENGLSGNFIWDICEDRQGNLWLATYSNGVSRFDGKSFTSFTTAEGLIDNEVRSILEDSKGHLWFGTFKGVSKHDGTAFTSDVVTRRLKGYQALYIMKDNNSNLWFGTRKHGALRFDGQVFTAYTTTRGLASNHVHHIMQDSSGNYWFSTDKGASKFDGRGFTNYTTKQGLKYNEVNKILEDRESNIWIATSIGLSRFRDETFTYFNEKQGLKNNIVWSFREDSRGMMWIATEEGIARYDPQKATLNMAGEKSCQGFVSCFYGDGQGNLWFCSDKSIIKYDGKQYTNFSKKNNLEPFTVFCMLEDGQGNMWFGTEHKGAVVWDGKTVKRFTQENGLLHNLVNDLLEDQQGNIWLATPQGLCKYDGVNFTFTHITTAHGLTNNLIMCIEKDGENSLWLGTYGGGIIKYTPPQNKGKARLQAFTTKDGLLNDEILSLAFDDHKYLWITSKKSISKFDAAEFSETGKKIFKHYSKDHGYYGIEPNEGALYRDRNGNIWIGTIYGAIKLNPQKDKPNTLEPAVYITGLKLFFGELDLPTYSNNARDEFGLPIGLELPHTRNHLTFEFVGICMTIPEKVRYQIMLEGFDPHWLPPSKATYATYSNLPPGEYVFKVKARNNEGVWNKKPAVYRFRIEPPFWQNWWFYLLSFAVVIGCLYGLIRFRTYKLKKQKQVLEEQVHLHTLELEQEKNKVEQINLELEQRVEERTRKLAIASEKLLHAQKMEAIGTLAGGVAHDLNNILAGIVNYPELLLMDIPPDNPYRHTILAIQRSGLKAAAIVQDMLTLARRGVTVTEIVKLEQVISEFLQSPEYRKIMASNPNVHIETHLEKSGLNIIGSPVHLSKTLMNLVSNAVEAMPYGGKLIIKTKNQHIGAHHHINGYSEVKEGDYVMLMVSDTGIGMSENDMKHVFEPFYTKKKMGKSGTGLGMAVVWGTVQDHNGYITMQSSEGEEKGTIFTLYFPATHLSLVKGQSHLTMNELMGNGESILVVDDVEEQREAASRILSKLRYSVHTVNSGEEAVEYLKTHAVDLLVLDMIMEPGISGLETYKQVLQMYPRQKTIIVSGYTETDDIKEAQKLGAGTYVKKPYGIETIGKAVKKELEK
jgi:ligand-binding sensor domain-containing protein/signal transduction histidine kinase/CheY-like chemotaxis protein